MKTAASRSHSAALVKLLGYTPAPPAEAPAAAAGAEARPKLGRPSEGAPGVGATAPAEKPKMTPRNGESRNFTGEDGRFIYYRGMRLSFMCGQVLLVRRLHLSQNPARNVKFLGNLQGTEGEWGGALHAASERAHAAGLVLLMARQYSDLNVSRPGGLDSNHCLHLFNHFRPPDKKMISKWETYFPVALHRTYDRLVRQPLAIAAEQLSTLSFETLFDALREKELRRAAAARDPRRRWLLLVTRRWRSRTALVVDDSVLARYRDGREWYRGALQAVHGDGTADVRYEDGDFERRVPAERILSAEREEGEWEYAVAAPDETKADSEQRHPWWPASEHFVAFVQESASARARERGVCPFSLAPPPAGRSYASNRSCRSASPRCAPRRPAASPAVSPAASRRPPRRPPRQTRRAPAGQSPPRPARKSGRGRCCSSARGATGAAVVAVGRWRGIARRRRRPARPTAAGWRSARGSCICFASSRCCFWRWWRRSCARRTFSPHSPTGRR